MRNRGSSRPPTTPSSGSSRSPARDRTSRRSAGWRSTRGPPTGFLAVKTLSDRDPYPPYAETHAFYEAMGFTPLMDLDIWGPDNPALLLVRSLVRPPTRSADDV